MRWSDLYMGLMGVTMGFGAVVGWTAGMPPTAIGFFLAGAVAFLIAMGWRAVHAPHVVLVGDPDPAFDLREELDQAGYAVRTCVGPAHRPCPVLHGGYCPVPGHPVAAIVHIPAGYTGPAAPCGRALGVWMLEVREAADDELPTGDHDGLTPIERPESVVAAMERALAG